MRVGDRFGAIVVEVGDMSSAGMKLLLGQGLILRVDRYIERAEAWVWRVVLDEGREPIGYWVSVLEPPIRTSTSEDVFLEGRLYPRDENKWILQWGNERVELLISGA